MIFVGKIKSLLKRSGVIRKKISVVGKIRKKVFFKAKITASKVFGTATITKKKGCSGEIKRKNVIIGHIRRVASMYIFAKIRSTIKVWRKSKLEAADADDLRTNKNIVEHNEAKLTVQPVSDLSVNKSINSSCSESKLETAVAVDLKANKRIALKHKAGLVALIFAPLKAVKKILIYRKSKLETANGVDLEYRKKAVVKRLADAEAAPTTALKSKKRINYAVKHDLEAANSVEMALEHDIPKEECTAELSTAAAVDLQAKKTVKVGCKAELSTWFYPSVDKDGILTLRQVYSATQDGDVLEVR